MGCGVVLVWDLGVVTESEYGLILLASTALNGWPLPHLKIAGLGALYLQHLVRSRYVSG
jgi:hypothetical protein